MLLLNPGISSKIKTWFNQEYPAGIEIYFDYRDTISAKTAQMITNQQNPKEYFYDWLYECTQDQEYEYKEEAYKTMLKNFLDKNYITEEEYDDAMYRFNDFWDIFQEEAYCNFDEKHFLNQKFECDIIIDSGDWQYDNGCNIIYPHYNGNEQSPQEIIKENCLAWLAKRQGYNRTQLFNYLNKPNYRKRHTSKFLSSCYQELANCSSSNNELVFLAKFTLEELIDMKEMKSITITKDTTCGLYDGFDGGGSLLKISLEKNIVLDPKWIGTIEIDEAADERNVIWEIVDSYKNVPQISEAYTHNNYSIKNVYGVYDTLWDCSTKINWNNKKAS